MDGSARTNALFVKLQSYYTRVGNRFIFSNGMTLNQISLALWEKLGYTDIDVSVLSRFLKGERLLNLHQFKTLCKILGIGEKEEQNLMMLLNQQILSQFGHTENFEYLRTGIFMENVKEDIHKIQKARAFNSPQLAFQWTDLVEEKIQKRIHSHKHEADRINLFLLLGELYIQKKILLLEGFPFDSIKNRLDFIKQQFYFIGKVTSNDEYFGHAHALKARTYFQYQNYKKVLKHTLCALKYLLPSEERSLVLCLTGINFALLRQDKEAIHICHEIEKEILFTPDRLDLICLKYKYISQILNIVGSEAKSLKYMDESWKIFDTKLTTLGNYTNIRKIQLDWNEFYIIKKYYNSNIERKNVLKSEALQLAQSCGYHEYIPIHRNSVFLT